MWIKTIVVAWIICGVLAYGITFGYFDGRFPNQNVLDRRQDMGFAVAVGLTGPLGLVASLACSGFAYHGLRFR